MTTPSETTPDNTPVQENAPEQNSAPNAAAPIELKYNPHEGVEESYLILPGGAQGAAVVKDLATYISRALAVNPDAAIRLTARAAWWRYSPAPWSRRMPLRTPRSSWVCVPCTCWLTPPWT